MQNLLKKTKTKKLSRFFATLGLCLVLALTVVSTVAVNQNVKAETANVETVQTYNAPRSTLPDVTPIKVLAVDGDTSSGSSNTIMSEIISNLTGGITETAQGIGSGINNAIKSIFIDTDGGLSTAGTIITIFAGISLCLGLTYLVVHFVFNLGGGRL